MELYTDRLTLRMMTNEDYKSIFEYSKEPNVGPNAGWEPHKNIEETINIANEMFINKETVWGIVLKENNCLIGSIGLVEDPKRENENARMLGYAISEKWWNMGIMTEAVEKVVQYGLGNMNLAIISAYTYPFNIASKRVLEKNGFKYEGTLKQAEKIYNGKIYDNDCYAYIAKIQ